MVLHPYDVRENNRVEQSFSGFNYRFGAGLTADFATLGLPVAVLLEYAMNRQPSSLDLTSGGELDTSHNVGLGAYYSGRENLQTGLEGFTQLGLGRVENRSGTSNRPHAFGGQLLLRYVF